MPDGRITLSISTNSLIGLVSFISVISMLPVSFCRGSALSTFRIRPTMPYPNPSTRFSQVEFGQTYSTERYDSDRYWTGCVQLDGCVQGRVQLPCNPLILFLDGHPVLTSSLPVSRSLVGGWTLGRGVYVVPRPGSPIQPSNQLHILGRWNSPAPRPRAVLANPVRPQLDAPFHPPL
jgi:hypothetical protein